MPTSAFSVTLGVNLQIYKYASTDAETWVHGTNPEDYLPHTISPGRKSMVLLSFLQAKRGIPWFLC